MVRAVLEIAAFGKFRTDPKRHLLKNPRVMAKELLVHEASRPDAPGRDLAEVIFGYVDKSDSLKGRVSFEAAIVLGDPQPEPPCRKALLQTPKGKFAPNYLQQPGAEEDPDGKLLSFYQPVHYGDDGARLRGWKRYWRRPHAVPADQLPLPPPVKSSNPYGPLRWDLASAFFPLPAGTKFIGRMHFHNLRPLELGALLWCLDWGGDPHLCHGLGLAKPYGYGAVRVRLLGNPTLAANRGGPPSLADCRRAFVDQMQAENGGGWLATPQLRALLAMANPDVQPPSRFGYPRFSDFKAYQHRYALLPIPGGSSRGGKPTPGMGRRA
jgi:CRISPR-associated protein (TIGR03986 family)